MTETNFKHTDLGLIPHDWEVKTLGEIGYLQNGYAYNSHTFGDIGYTVIRISDIKDGNVVLSDAIKSIVKAPDSFLVKKGNFLIAMSGATTGKVGLYAYEKSAYINQRVGNVICMDADSGYVRYSFNSVCFSEYLTSIITAGAQPNISKKQIEEFAFPLPPTLAEQERIAGALSSIDTLIGALTEQIEKKRHIKQGAMQQLLTGKKRLAGFTGEWMKRSIWEVTIWDKKFNGVEDYKQPEIRKYPYALAQELLSMEDNNGDVFLLSTGSYSGWTTEEKAGDFLCEGEVVTIPWGGVANVKYTKGKFVTADNRLATSNNIQVLSNKFLYLAMLLRTDMINSFYRGASIKHPSMEDVLNLEITFPPTIAEQSAIAAVLSGMDTEIAALEQKRDKYIAIKSGMMQNLLTGKIRLV
jgi:restriction endonuclease S subunit